MRGKISLMLISLLLFGVLMPTGLLSYQVQAATSTIVVQNGFEEGLVGSWVPFNCSGGTPQLSVSTEQAATGEGSLQLSGRGSVSCSPSIELKGLLKEGHSYNISYKLKLGVGTDQSHATMKMTNQANDYDWVIGNQSVNDQGWTTFSKIAYTRPANTDSLTLYIETTTSTADVFIDDFLIVDTTLPDGSGEPGTTPTGPAEFGYSFDNGTTEGWGSRGDGVVVAVSQEQKHSGQYSLKTTGRTNNWHGPTVNVFDKLTKDAKYEVSAYVKLVDPPSSSHAFKISAELDASGSKSWVSIASAAVSTAEWVQLKGTFSFSANLTNVSFYIESADANDAYYVDDVLVKMTEPPKTSPPVQTDLAKLSDVYSDYFKIGAALEPNQLEGKSRELLDLHFSSIVAENAMKPGSINGTKGTYNFDGADRLADYAREHQVNMRFHTLVWHEQAAEWMFKGDDGLTLAPTPENKALVLQRLKEYLGVVVPRYADVASDWDVVNEVIDEGRPNGMRNSLWYQLTGDDFIKVAFTETRRLLDEMYAQDAVKYAAAKTSKLIINDYGTHNPQKANFLLSLITRLKAEGVPIDGVGHQTHINISGPSIQQISNSIQLFGEAGFDNQLTEFDVSVYTNNTDSYSIVPSELLAKQGYRFKELFDELKRLDDKGRTAENPEGWISNITFWGIADNHTWLHNRPVTRQDAPFAFDNNFQAKPAYWGMVDPSKLTAVKKTANAAYGSPALSNRNDFVWSTVPNVSLEKSGALGAVMKLLWDENHLYVKATVTDPSKLPGDKVELFVNNSDQIQTVLVERGSSHSVETTQGYTVVAEIPLSGGIAGGKVSFDIRVTDSGADDGTEHGKNGSIISWSDLGNNQDKNSSGYGELTLIPATKIAQASYGTPVVDGQLDELWAGATKLATDVKVEGGEGSKADFYTTWDDQYLYVYAVVTDKKLSLASTNPWEQDSIEIFLDQNNGKTSAYEEDDGQYRINYENVHTVGGHASHDNYTSATKVVYGAGGIPTGYVVEAALALDRIKPGNGTVVGFDLQVNNDDNGTGKRDSVWMWNDPTGKSYENTSRFGVIAFTGKPEDSESGNPSSGSNSGSSSKPGEITAVTDTAGNAKAVINTSDLQKAIAASTAGLLKFQVIGVEKAKQISLAMSGEQVQAARIAGIQSVELSLGNAIIQLPVSLFEQEGQLVSMEVSVATADSLPAGIGEQIGASAVYDFKLSVGGKPISQFGKGLSAIVSLPYTLKGGENANQIVAVYIADDGRLEYIKKSGYDALTGRLKFSTSHFSQYTVVARNISFKDTASLTWANDSIVGLAARGIVSGVSAQIFEPNRAITRAEFTHMLIQTLGLEQKDARSSFLDVKEGAWYYGSIAAAQHLGIIEGLPDGSFGLNDRISRQDMATMVYRALQSAGIKVENANNKVAFQDETTIAPYAKEAVAALQIAGIVNGMGDGSFAPQAVASRAQAAVMLYSLLQKLV